MSDGGKSTNSTGLGENKRETERESERDRDRDRERKREIGHTNTHQEEA
jgi:hypothetical protein